MHADIKGSLEYMKNKTIHFEHRGVKLTQEQTKKVLEYGLNNRYKTTADFTDEEINGILGWEICYKTNKICVHYCSGLCRESC